MKDEEMAEEWVRTNRNILKDCLSACVRTEHKDDIQAFLAGLKAGRPQWHKVTDGDLPKEGTEVLNDDGVKVVRINGHWRYVYGEEWEDDAHLDHWCEIPTFDKE